MIPDFTKIIRPFTVLTDNNREVSVFCKIEFKHGKLSIKGVEGPLRNGDCHGSCGQITIDYTKIKRFAEGWTFRMVERFRDIWDEWHLNDMRPYSPEMKAAGWHKRASIPVWVTDENGRKRETTLGWLTPAEHPEGLLGRKLNINDSKGYGDAWWLEEVPDDVLAWLQALPDADRAPAWV